MLDHLKRLLKGSAIYGIGNALNQFINLLLLPLFTSYLSPADYGVTSILSMFTLVIYNVFTLGFGTSIGISYYHTSEQNTRIRIIWTAFAVLAISGLMPALSGFFFADRISGLLFHTEENAFYIILTLITSFFTMLNMPLILKLQFEERQVEFVVLTVLSTFLNIFLNVLLIIILDRGLEGRIQAIMLASICSFLIYFIPAIKSLRNPFNLTIGKELIMYGVPLIPSFLAIYILQQGNIYILQNYSTLDNVGLFSVGFSFGSAILIIFSAFSTAWFPFAMSFEKRRDEAEVLFGKIFSYFIILGGLLSGGFYIFSYPVVDLFTQVEFQQSYIVIGITSSALLFLSIFNILIIPIYYQKEVHIIPFIQIISALVFVLTGIILIKKYGVIGAGLNLLLGYLIMASLTLLWTRYRKSSYLRIQFEWTRVVPFMLFYSLFIFSTLLINDPKTGVFINSSIFILLVGFSYLTLTSIEKNYIIEYIRNTVKSKS